jgi:pyruvate formate-lyase activating enzyme-like uncharacterized protein
MKPIISWLKNSAYIKPLSLGCTQCAKGSKMVLLITGKCTCACFYCPLSKKKYGKDVIYADEWQLKNEKDTHILIEEAHAIDAEGAGITGGDPLLVWQRTREYITILKKEFGSSFHIHLYTSGLVHPNHISDLIKAGLDEIRFHPPPSTWNTLSSSPIVQTIYQSVKSTIDVALEIPVLPNHEKDIIALIQWADTHNIQYINLNELEFSERNASALIQRDYHGKNDLSAAVHGSQETAINILQNLAPLDLNIGIHYCSVSFKDGIQLRNRIKRRAHITKKPFQEITRDGTFIFGIITPPKYKLDTVFKELQDQHKIPPELIEINILKNRIELAEWILVDIAAQLLQKGYLCYLVEEYPTTDRLEVERIPLPLD